MTLGDVQAFVQYSRQFTQPLTQVASMMNVLQSGVASAERVFELLDAGEERPDSERPATLEHVRGHVEFDDVSFRYVAERPLIRHLSLDVQPGQTVAIVGPTGAGKTTLVNLIMRFYELDGGAIRLDGVDIATMSRRDVRGEIGMVLQDAWLFGGTIRDNIAYGGHGCDRGADPRGGADQLRRPLRPLTSRRLRHRRRRPGQQPQRRRTPARDDRQSVPRRSRRSSSSTRRRALSTRAPRCSSSRRWPPCAPTARAS